MDDVRAASEDLMADKPETATVLRELLDVDADGPWTFEDVPADSGLFGEIVSRGIAESHQDGYRLADREAIRQALGDGPDDHDRDTHEDSASPTRHWPSVSVRSGVDRRLALALGGLLVILVLARTVFAAPSVFVNGDVVLAGNDPWFYRYWVEQLAGPSGPGLPGGLADLPGDLPTHDVLMIATMWILATLLGGAGAVGVVLALYPVLSAVIVGICLYVLTVRLTRDRRVALASVLVLALTPVHSYRTMLGFGDHHAFDYLWLAVTALALVTLAIDWRPATDRSGMSQLRRAVETSRRRWAVAGVAVGVSAQALSWRGAPLLLLPLGIYIAYEVLVRFWVDESPFAGVLPVLVGLGFASVLTLLVHVLFGWVGTIRASIPALLLVGGLFVAGLAALLQRLEADRGTALGGTIAGIVGLFTVLWLIVPGFASLWIRFLEYMARTGQRGIAETQSLFETGSLFGPILLFGGLLVLGFGYAAVITWEDRWRLGTGWRPLVTYGWFLGALSILQIRFAGPLSLFVAVFAGAGYVHLAAVVDLVQAPRVFRDGADAPTNGGLTALEWPGWRRTGSLLVLLVLVLNVGILQIPVKQGQVATSTSTYETATWIDDYAEDRDLSYPENYVFSGWGENRIYNYFVSGQSRSYTFARANFQNFTDATDPTGWYQRLRGQPGFVVLGPRSGLPSDALHTRLYERVGGRGPNVRGLGHYRAIRVDSRQKVFDIVSGATIVGVGQPGRSLDTETTVSIGENEQAYRRTVETNEAREYALTVPYPGEYAIGNRTWSVTESQIRSDAVDERLLIDESIMAEGDHGEFARWQFDLPTDPIALERVGGSHGEIHGGYVDLRGQRPSLVLDGEDDRVSLPAPDHKSEPMTVSLWFKTGPTFEPDGAHSAARLLSTSGPGRLDEATDGYQLAVSNGGLVGAVGNGSTAAVASARSVTDGNWRHAALRYNGTNVTIFFEGRPCETVRYDGSRGTVEAVMLGATSENSHNFAGEIDDVRFYDRALFDRQVRSVYLAGRHGD